MVDTSTTALFTALQADRTVLADALDRPALRGIKNVLTDLTQGEAHFIYELLQNADDARATQVRFCLLPEGLSVWHNAPQKFTISDVATEEEDTGTAQLGHLNALTSIGNSTKRRGTSSVDSDTIGRFGIGFKSVFHYTATPHVYEDELSFRLERILVPVPLTDRHALPPGLERGGAEWTQLWLPFNHAQRPAAEAYQHVLRRLRTLRLPLLFLRNLTEISWEARPVFQELITDSGYYLREIPRLLSEQATTAIRVEYVELIQEDRCTNTDTGDQVTVAAHRFVVVKQPCHDHLNLPVCLAFALRDNGTLDPSADDRGHEAFCFFATRHRTGLRFLLQAPWLLTNNREAIKADQPWNQQLVQQLAQLLAASLPLLRDLRPADLARPGTPAAPYLSLLTDELLQLLPLSDAPDAEQRTVEELRQRQELSFRPFHAAVFEALRTLPLLPTATGTHIGATHAYYAESRELSQAFGQEQLRQLMQDPAAEWVFDSVGGKENKFQTAYLRRLLSASHLLEPKEAASRLTAAFMEAQTDEWLTAFYLYLSTGPGYLLDGQNDAILRHRGALLRLANDKHLAPYAAVRDTEPQVFLPPTSGGFQSNCTLKSCFAQDEQLASFRRRLGLTTPKQLTVMLEYILPQYTGAEGPSLAEHLEHIAQILDCWQTCSQQEQVVLRERLLVTPFMRGYIYPSATPEYRWYRPGQLYRDNEDLRQYFTASEATFVDEDTYAGITDMTGVKALWQALSVATVPRVIQLDNQPITADDRAALWKVRSTWTEDQKVVNHDLDGLAALLAPGIIPQALSQTLFGFLCLCIEQADVRLFNRVYTFSYYGPNPVITASQALLLLRQTAWLYDQIGQPRHPHEFAAADIQLANGYILDTSAAQELLRRLDILSPRQKVLDGLPAAERELVEFFREMKSKGFTVEEIRAAIAKLRPAPTVVPPTPAAEPLADQERKQTWQATREAATSPPPAAEPTSSAESAAEAPEGEEDDYLSEASRRKLLRAQQQVQQLEDELRQQDELFREVEQTERYTYSWFQALLTLETRLSNRRNEGASGFSLSFGRVEKDPDAPLLILHEPVGPIPRTVEDHPELKLRLYRRGQPDQSIQIDVVSIKDFTLRAKLRKEDWAAIDPASIQRASIQVQSPAFLLDELVRQFNQLAHSPHNFTADTNLQANLPAKLRFVFGPPGTGKTYHLAHREIEQLMQQAEPVRILVLTPTNKAADVLTARLLPAAEAGLPPERPDWLFRYGVPADTNLEQVPGLVQDKKLNVSDLERCTVLTTAARFPYALCDGGYHYLAAVPWDYIILDEASMIPLYQAVNVIYQQPHCREFIIGGDPLQIPPVVHAEPWAGENIYTLVGLDNFDVEVTPQHQFPVHKLLTQRRATPPLGRLFSQFAYGGRLQHARPLTGTAVLDGHTYQGRRPETFGALPLSDITVIPFPVRRGEGILEARKLEQGSNYQAYSALLAAELTRYLAQHIQPAPAPDTADRYRVGIITPYTAQAALLRELLKQLPLSNAILNPNEDVGTIHGFQGDECNLVIALFAPPPTTGDRILLSYQHILNVAISRARDRLVLLVPEYEDDRSSGLGLQRLRQLLGLLNHEQEGQVTHLTAKAVEQVLFGPDHEEFILSNSFTTSHQLVNVYGQGVARYELRFGPTAVDVQVNLKAKLAEADILP
ncbi:DEAD/DEAH box helicase [Hymenobacter swuensis]|uniref:Uncharacterized protein n=1 Tax=Hymenobacter swuensis DY53 TaxID=1227739 RepID=W8ESN3_9BACT|nr:AAA domain-containing protein [Hymenobacter swuensis]AHJ95533.1 hypothetical protein Hsw_PA0200 [Hymenobacter swuensis DY53]